MKNPSDFKVSGEVVAYCFVDKFRDIATDRRVRSVCINDSHSMRARILTKSVPRLATWMAQAAAWCKEKPAKRGKR